MGADADALSRAHHVAVGVHDALGISGRPRRIEPETVVHGGGRRRRQARRLPGHQVPEAARADAEHPVRGRVARLVERALDGVGEFGTVEQGCAFGIVDHEAIVVGAQHRVDRHRNDARLDRAEEGVDELRAVLDQHQDAFARADAERFEHVAAAVDSFGELCVCDGFLDRSDRRLVRPSFVQVAVDERHRDIENRCETQRRRTGGIVDHHRVVLHDQAPQTSLFCAIGMPRPDAARGPGEPRPGPFFTRIGRHRLTASHGLCLASGRC